jgi:hypothetical protein
MNNGFKTGDKVTFRHSNGVTTTVHHGIIYALRTGFWNGCDTRSMGAEIACADGQLRFRYLHDLARDVQEIPQGD